MVLKLIKKTLINILSLTNITLKLLLGKLKLIFLRYVVVFE